MRVVTIIPTYNEIESLPLTLARLRAAVPASDVLIVDDNSPDGTGELADRAAALASFGHPLEAGLAIEAAAGLPTLQTALAGAKRFAGGEGRGGAGSGV